MKKLKHKLTYAIMILVIASFLVALYNRDWTSVFANFTAFCGWFTVLGYEKREMADEALLG